MAAPGPGGARARPVNGRPSLGGLQARISLLVLCAVVPAVALMVYTNLEERRLKAADAHDDALRLARLISADHERLIEGARELLVTLARLPAVRGAERAACGALFADLLQQYPAYANFGVIAPDGNLICSALPSGAVFLGDRTYFQRAVATREFAVGDFQVGRVTRKATINFGYPVLDARGAVQGVAFSALDLAWINRLAARAELPGRSMLSVIDRNGTLLARYPSVEGQIGERLVEPALLAAVAAGHGSGTAQTVGADGVQRLHSFVTLGQGGVAYVVVGIPTDVAYADAQRVLRRNLSALAVVALLALAAAWVGGRLFIVRPTRKLVAFTRRLSAGELGARIRLTRAPGEIGELARALDDMAESLEQIQRQHLLEDELRQKNFELEEHNRAVQEANRLKSEFVSMVSHELRTPLASIQGYVELLLEDRDGSLSGEQRESLTTVRSNADRVLWLINDLLDLSRIEAGRIDLRRTRLDLGGVIRDVALSLRPLVDAKRQRLHIDVRRPLPPVWADGDRVAQILTNLVSNAHKYTPTEGTITVAAVAEDGAVRVEVRDTGIGLSQDEHARLFTPFFRARTEHAGAPAGTGLGLVITRLLVELHGGEMTVSSTPGAGATFSFSLPAARDQGGPAAEE